MGKTKEKKQKENKESGEKCRGPNYSADEKKVLLQLALAKKAIIECTTTDSLKLRAKNETWEEIAADFNTQMAVLGEVKVVRMFCSLRFSLFIFARHSLCSVLFCVFFLSSQQRDVGSLREKYTDMKRQLRKQAGNERRQRFATGGGRPPEEIEFATEELQQLSAAISLSTYGTDAAVGDSDYVPPISVANEGKISTLVATEEANIESMAAQSQSEFVNMNSGDIETLCNYSVADADIEFMDDEYMCADVFNDDGICIGSHQIVDDAIGSIISDTTTTTPKAITCTVTNGAFEAAIAATKQSTESMSPSSLQENGPSAFDTIRSPLPTNHSQNWTKYSPGMLRKPINNLLKRPKRDHDSPSRTKDREVSESIVILQELRRKHLLAEHKMREENLLFERENLSLQREISHCNACWQ